jgi:hypothetical protein
MNRIQITIEHEEKQYNAHFTNVMGAGDTSTYHLIDNKNFYLGRLRRYAGRWAFDATPKSAELRALADYFGDYITNWNQ